MIKDQELTEIPENYLELPFCYDGKEVRLTGRMGRQKSRSGRIKIVWEICPLSMAYNAPKNTNYNKWVLPTDLFHITGNNKLVEDYEQQKTKEESNVKT